MAAIQMPLGAPNTDLLQLLQGKALKNREVHQQDHNAAQHAEPNQQRAALRLDFGPIVYLSFLHYLAMQIGFQFSCKNHQNIIHSALGTDSF